MLPNVRKFAAINLNKRQRFVFIVFLLSGGFVFSQLFIGARLVGMGLLLSVATIVSLFIILRKDIKDTFYLPIFILPFFYSLAFVLFYSLIPARILSKTLLTVIFAFGLYSLFLTQNIFAVSTIRTINLLRSARIVSFVITVFILYFILNIIFSFQLPIYITPFLIFIILFFMNFQSLWIYSLDKSMVGEIITFSFLISLCLAELSLVLAIWPVNASIYSIFLTGIFYTYSGLCHAWIEKRLFKGVLWEYVWVGCLSIFILIAFSRWGI